ncbi:LysR family transcriptional regulator [Cupriavidus agavae]|uniref:DNA-binding transcriptional LysR family regulator n=1 Tax=Cupriavidus agavae TaxID=1001822 RepID=A0A4Q7S2C2_9BURK|nr:LysR family transcriptional regulator [Cupriavidus agavae]RZT39390.1 DNA-binding transcriptional LysR family regulator [Cupriavidus agavae]
MSTVLPSTADLRVFVLVAQLASFTQAALRLQVPRSTVSTSIIRLEKQLGARLLQRTTRRVVLTREGEELLGRSERLLDDFEELAQLFRADNQPLQGLLRVDMPLGMATGVVMAALPAFLQRHPALQIEVSSTDRRVDVIADGFDCVVRAGNVVDESLVSRPLAQMPLINVASRDYVGAHGRPENLADLAAHWLVNYMPNRSSTPAGFEYHEGGKLVSVPMAHRVTVNNSSAYSAACRAGFGIAQIPTATAAPDLRTGLLIEVMARYRPEPMPVNLLYPHRRNVPARVRQFGDWLGELLKSTIQ